MGDGAKTQTGYLVLADISGYTSFVAKMEIEHANMALCLLLETIFEKLSRLLTISKLEIYCSVCGLELCYTE